MSVFIRLFHPFNLFFLVLVPLSLSAQSNQDVTITVSDGVRLDATITRPRGVPPSGGFPAVILIHGYGGSKNEMSQIMQVMAIYGYASLAYSVRGQGNSEGFSSTMGERERQDLLEVITYLRNAALINPNKLGVAGGSQGGIHAWMTAALRMPGVLAVVPLIATPNFARDLVPSGCVKWGLPLELSIGSVRYTPDRDRIRDLIIRDVHDSVLVYINERNLAHLVDSIQIPVLQALGWADYLFPANWGIRTRAQLAARRMNVWSYFGTNGHGEPIDTTEAGFVFEKTLQWFDHWLRGSSLPEADIPVVFYADDRPGWPHHTSPEWPPVSNSTMRFYVTQDALSSTLPTTPALLQFSVQYNSTYTPAMGWNDLYGGANFRNAFQSSPVRLISAPLQSQIEVTGIPRAQLFVSSSSSRFQAHVKLYDVATNGTGFDWRNVSRGAHCVRGNLPNTTLQLDYECQALSHIVPAGHRIGLEVTSIDWRADNAAFIVPFFESTTALLLSTASSPSYIDIPVIGGTAAVLSEAFSMPQTPFLHQNYPNPFNPRTNIKFQIPRTEMVMLSIVDLLGNEVATIMKETKDRGSYEVTFDASGLASGVYFCRLKSDNRSVTKPMLLLR